MDFCLKYGMYLVELSDTLVATVIFIFFHSFIYNCQIYLKLSVVKTDKQRVKSHNFLNKENGKINTNIQENSEYKKWLSLKNSREG